MTMYGSSPNETPIEDPWRLEVVDRHEQELGTGHAVVTDSTQERITKRT